VTLSLPLASRVVVVVVVVPVVVVGIARLARGIREIESPERVRRYEVRGGWMDARDGVRERIHRARARGVARERRARGVV